MKDPMKPGPQITFDAYAIGYGISILLTLSSFFLAPEFGAYALPAIVLAAVVQLFVQLVFFLHLGRRRDATLVLLVFTAVIIGILVIGTLWIMSNLARLHRHEITPADLYQGGVVAPQNELR